MMIGNVMLLSFQISDMYTLSNRWGKQSYGDHTLDKFHIDEIDVVSENFTASSDCQIFQFDILELEITMFD